MINLFYEPFPVELELDSGSNVGIITDFREYIKLIDMLDDEELSDFEKQALLVKYVKTESVQEALSALDPLLAFVRMDEMRGGVKADKEAEEERGDKPLFSYSFDFGAIYSSFLRCYQIDLINIEYLHWWEFRLLFDGLPDDTEIKQRIYYRNVNVATIKDGKERARIRRIQNAIRIPTNGVISDFEIGGVF